MKTNEQMIDALVHDALESIVQLSIQGDWMELEAWLGPIFRDDFDSCSEDEIRSRYIAQGLADSEEEED